MNTRPTAAMFAAVIALTLTACSNSTQPQATPTAPSASDSPAMPLASAAPTYALAAPDDVPLPAGWKRAYRGANTLAIDPTMDLAAARDTAGNMWIHVQHYRTPSDAPWTLYRNDQPAQTGTGTTNKDWWPLTGPGRYALQVNGSTIAVWEVL